MFKPLSLLLLALCLSLGVCLVFSPAVYALQPGEDDSTAQSPETQSPETGNDEPGKTGDEEPGDETPESPAEDGEEGATLAAPAAEVVHEPATDTDAGEEHLEAEGDEADHGHHELGHGYASKSLMDPAELQADLAIYALFIFLCLMALLSKFAWPKIAEALDKRERAISDNIAAAQEKHDQAAALLAEHQAKINAAAEEVREMLEEARRDAEAAKGQIVTEGRAVADAELQRALREIENAKDGAVKSLAEQSAALAVDLASKVVRQEISHERQSEIVREALGLMGSGNGVN